MGRAAAACAVLLLAGAAPAPAMTVFAHRGGPLVENEVRFPENTLPAFRHAARAGTALELDVRLTLDRVPLVIHDETFDRTTTCTGPVALYDSGAAARRCRALWPFRRATAPVPRLGQVLRVAAARRVPAMVEIKGTGDARAIVDAIRASPLPRRLVIVQSFDHRALSVARRRWPGVPTALLSPNADRHAALRRSTGRFAYVAPRWPVDRHYVRRARAAGVRVLPFSVNTDAGVRRAARIGVDALITNDPSAARRVLRGGETHAGRGATRFSF